MDGLRISDRPPATRPIGRAFGIAAGWSLCAAALLTFVNSTAGVTQTLTAAQGWQNAQYRVSAVGDPERGGHVAEAKCAACHGADGNSPDSQFPKLAAQKPAYLYWQLWLFKQGTRKSDVMSGIVATLSDADMANVASFYSRQPRKANIVKDTRLAAIGERVFFSGMPSCAMCHGSGGRRNAPMMGMMGGGMMGRGMMGAGMGDVPTLDGQHAAYIVDQLNRFAGGEREGTVMNRIAPALSETNRRAVAEFLSSQP